MSFINKKRLKNIEYILPIIAVSYTHLDVYKRQRYNMGALGQPPQSGEEVPRELSYKTGMKVAHKSFGQGIIIDVRDDGRNVILKIVFPGKGIKAVSYTHLDVYKRQPPSALIVTLTFQSLVVSGYRVPANDTAPMANTSAKASKIVTYFFIAKPPKLFFRLS